MPNNETPPKFTVLNWNALVKEVWGPEWNAPEVAYEWSNDKKHILRTEDFGPYNPK